MYTTQTNARMSRRKTCSSCETTKPASAFYLANTTDGLDDTCRECRKANGTTVRANSGLTPRPAVSFATRRQTEPGMKHCPRCDTTKATEDFYLLRRNGTKRQSYCIECQKLDQRILYRDRRENARLVVAR